MRRMNCWTVFAFVVVLFSCTIATAQAAPPADPSKAILQFAQRFEANMMGIAQAMPADKYDFAPNSDTFKAGSPAKFDTVRTFAQQLTHVADFTFKSYSAFLKPDNAIDSKTLTAMTSKDDVLKALQAAFDYQNKVIASLTADNAFTPQGARNATLASTIVSVLNDDGDHYGQLVEYGRMNGVIPPATERQMQGAPPAAQK